MNNNKTNSNLARRAKKSIKDFETQLLKLTALSDYTSWEAKVMAERILPKDNPDILEIELQRYQVLLEQLNTIQSQLNKFVQHWWALWESSTNPPGFGLNPHEVEKEFRRNTKANDK